MKKQVLVAPLNWGLGHAARCIPIIDGLLEENFEPIIASDGVALDLLKKEFPDLEFIELPSYKIQYSKKGKNFKLKLIKDSPKVLKAIKAERKFIKRLVKEREFYGLISDNRLGVYSKHVPSVFITHQINVLSGNTTWFSSKLHQRYIKKFDECWVPDQKDLPSLSGKLGHSDSFKSPLKYLGPISRFNKKEVPAIYKVLVLLSGPEPQRSFLEKKLLEAFNNYPHKVLFIKGIVEEEFTKSFVNHMEIVNFMTSKELESAINESELVVSRSGYTTIMDLAKLGKAAFFIPTPGQFEQEYLAEVLDQQGIVPSCSQNEFNVKQLKRVTDYSGLSAFDSNLNFKSLFHLFERK